MLQFCEKKTIHRIFAWADSMKAISSCLNVKPDDRLLPYSVPEVLNKT